MTEKQVTVRQQVVVVVLNHVAFGEDIEIDQDVTAEDDVHTFHEGHASVVEQVDPAEGNAGFHLIAHLELIFEGLEVFLAKVGRQVAGAVVAIDTLLAVGQGPFVKIGGQDLEGPVFHQVGSFLQQDHAQGVWLFAGRAAGTPDS